MFIRFDIIHERDGHTHTQTHTPHSIASRGKSASIFEEHRTVCLLAPVDCILQATTSTNDYALLQLYGRLHSAEYAVARCLSVCLSACLSQVGIITKRLNMASNVSPSDSHTILVFFNTKHYGNIPTKPPNGGVECRWGTKKNCNFDHISIYLENDTR